MQLNNAERNSASRAQWLAELADAIEGAQRLAWQLGTSAQPSSEARELYSRLEAARIEVESMRGVNASAGGPIVPPAWLDSLGFSRALLDRVE